MTLGKAIQGFLYGETDTIPDLSEGIREVSYPIGFEGDCND